MKVQTKTPKITKSEKPAKAAKSLTENPMRKIFIEKVLLSAGGIEDDLKKASKLLNIVSGMKTQIIASQKRIPDFGVNPGLEVGTRVTIRGEKGVALLKRLLGALDNQLLKSQITDNHFSFGIKEYIEIPGMEYQRDIGTRGFNITVVFARAGLRVKRKKMKSGRIPKKQFITKDEIIKYLEENFKTKIN
jgi:large subunit ribosomal protein L5